MAPQVSVIIPVFERAEKLENAINSVLKQSYKNFELIVVDDGSGPCVRAVLSSFQDARIKLIRHGKRLGAAAARNSGIKASTASLIAFLDSDDEWLPQKLETQVAFILKQHDCKACVSEYFIREKGRPIDSLSRPEARYAVGDMLVVCNLSTGTTLLAYRELFAKVGLFDTNFSRFEDWDWLLRCLEISPVITVPEPLALIKVGNWAHASIVQRAAAQLLEKHRKRVRDLGFLPYFRFRSSLFYEVGVAAYKHGSYFTAGCYVLCSLVMYPTAPRGLWRRLGSSLRIFQRRSEMYNL